MYWKSNVKWHWDDFQSHRHTDVCVKSGRATVRERWGPYSASVNNVPKSLTTWCDLLIQVYRTFVSLHWFQYHLRQVLTPTDQRTWTPWSRPTDPLCPTELWQWTESGSCTTQNHPELSSVQWKLSSWTRTSRRNWMCECEQVNL